MKVETYILLFPISDELSDMVKVKECAMNVQGASLCYNKEFKKDEINNFLIKNLPILDGITFDLYHINSFINALNEEYLILDNFYVASVTIFY